LIDGSDTHATKEIEAVARRVATVTALVPMALADVIAVLYCNVKMIHRIAQIYGGRGGLLGSWRLLHKVTAHLIATGAIAIGDDWLSSVLGGGLFSKLSRRFGEGVVNAALTARIERTAIEVCRPLPFVAQQRPMVAMILKNAVSGLFVKRKD